MHAATLPCTHHEFLYPPHGASPGACSAREYAAYDAFTHNTACAPTITYQIPTVTTVGTPKNGKKNAVTNTTPGVNHPTNADRFNNGTAATCPSYHASSLFIV